MAGPVLLSGSDDRLLGNLFMLLQGLEEQDPGSKLYVCDFGYSPKARRFLEQLGILVPKPAFLKGFQHPWYAKAAMGEFLPPEMTQDGFVWIDADIIPVSPVADKINAVTEAMAAEECKVALCPDSADVTLGAFIAEWAERGSDIAPFSSMLDSYGVSLDKPYLNTGFMICRDARLARAWRDLVLRQSEWLLFEQNSFNCLAHAAGHGLKLLDTSVWNAHGALLDDVTLEPPSAHLIHTTSAGDRHIDGPAKLALDGGFIDLHLKLFLRQDLRDRQMGLLQRFLSRHASALYQAGLAVRPDR